MRNGIPAVLALALLSTGAIAQGPTGAPNTSSPAANRGAAAGVPANANAASADAPDSKGPTAKLNSGDQAFFNKAAGAGLAEVAAGQLAESQGSSDDVKSFGRQMVRDHGKANDEMKQLAAKKGVTLPATPDQDHQKTLDELKQKEGGDFDKAYVKSQVKDHKEAVSLFGTAAKSKDPDIAAFAGKTLMVLKEHQTMIKAIDGKMSRQ